MSTQATVTKLLPGELPRGTKVAYQLRHPFCDACGDRIPTIRPHAGRAPRFCSNACRQAAYRRRRNGLGEAFPSWAGHHLPIRNVTPSGGRP